MNKAIIEYYFSTPDDPKVNDCGRCAVEFYNNGRNEYNNLAYAQALVQAVEACDELIRKHPKHMIEIVHKHGGPIWKVQVEQE